MYQGVIRNNRQRDEMMEFVRQIRLPFKFAFQDIYPSKSPDQLAYLFGVVLKIIADHSGHSILEVYEGYKSLFNIQWSELGGVWDFRIMGASTHNTRELSEFTEKIVADATIDMGLSIGQPNEIITS